ncbi:MAG: glycogen debranching N-terminal domain-containing protein [Bacteroidota bacterium]
MNYIEVENQYYILATSSFADHRTMVLKQGDTFAIFDWYGDILQIGSGAQGIFHMDTRYLSRMELTMNGRRPLLLSSSPREDNQMLMVDLTNPDLKDENGAIVYRDTIHVLRSKFLWRSAYYEKIKVLNFGLEPIRFTVEIKFEADFIDIFEVRGSSRARRGERFPVQHGEDTVMFSYRGLDELMRKTVIAFHPRPNDVKGNIVTYDFHLKPKQEIEIEVNMALLYGDKKTMVKTFDEARTEMNRHMDRVGRYCAEIFTSNEQFNDWVNRSKSDLITMTTTTAYGLYPYAGVPWFSTPFGRDGIITALECLWVEPELAKGVLRYLAKTQAHDFDDFQDAEPGKIFHETRGGEMSAMGEVPFRLYYGTIDATPMFVSLAGAYLDRTNDLATIKEIWPNIEKALYWIDHYGDIDGDGFVEYKTKSSKGLINQGWKDSQDAIFYEDGRLAQDPIALCEVQGYVYDAKVKASEMARRLQLMEAAERLEREAIILKENFNDQFWSESKNTYVLALDGHKRPCNVLSSNAGQCLFSGIATPERARQVARNLIGEQMFSGWGIRTIAANEARYNPMSYHNGSIWPHDNALIAYGFSRYNLQVEVAHVVTGIFDSAIFTEGQRLPELFCGFERRKGQAPTSYPVACSPQAWSVGAVFMMLQACLGLKIDAAANKITFCHPILPAGLQEITITNLRLNGRQIILQVRKGKEGIDVIQLSHESDVVIEVHNQQLSTIEPMPLVSSH